MCLGIPGKVIKIDGLNAKVLVGEVEVNASLWLVPDVKKGEYVLLHAGFAIQTIDEEAAKETLELLEKIRMEEEKV